MRDELLIKMSRARHFELRLMKHPVSIAATPSGRME